MLVLYLVETATTPLLVPLGLFKSLKVVELALNTMIESAWAGYLYALTVGELALMQ